MEDGLVNKKVGFIIQARMKSTRLPGKILMPLPLGSEKPLLSWVIQELKKSRHQSKIYVATSQNSENDILIPFCNKEGVDCFRGDEENVLSRFLAIAKQDKFDCIVRLTADNPIVDIAILDETIEKHFIEKNDYTCTKGLPVGMNFEVITSKALLDIENHEISDPDKEHVTLFVKNSGLYKLGVFCPDINPEFQNLRLTVDYVSDYTLLSVILSQNILNKNKLSGISLIDRMYLDYPWLFAINDSNIQKKHFTKLNDELIEACICLKKFDFNNAAKILENYVE